MEILKSNLLFRNIKTWLNRNTNNDHLNLLLATHRIDYSEFLKQFEEKMSNNFLGSPEKFAINIWLPRRKKDDFKLHILNFTIAELFFLLNKSNVSLMQLYIIWIIKNNGNVSRKSSMKQFSNRLAVLAQESIKLN